MSAIDITLIVLLSVLSLFLVWLVMTERWQFPILFDSGLALMVLGMVATADAIASQRVNILSFFLILSGAVTLLVSLTRQSGKAKRQMRYGEPRVIDGQSLRRTSGGTRK